MDYLKLVAQFHHIFNHPVLSSPTIPNPDRCKLRLSLLQEELRELEQAIEAGHLVGIADALCDLQYVLSGAILEFGMKDKFTAMFEEVHSSNMSKACDTIEQAAETILKYKDEGVAAGYVVKDGKFLVYRSFDNKALKSIAYSPANLEQFIEK